MELLKLIEEKKKRNKLRNAVLQSIQEFDFSKHIMRSKIHVYVCAILNKKVSNQIISKIKLELINQRIVPTRSGNRLYYHNVNNCRNYTWLKHRYLKESQE